MSDYTGYYFIDALFNRQSWVGSAKYLAKYPQADLWLQMKKAVHKPAQPLPLFRRVTYSAKDTHKRLPTRSTPIIQDDKFSGNMQTKIPYLTSLYL